MTDDDAPATLLQRMVAAGISEDRARERIGQERVRVDGATVTDPDAPAPWPTPWVIGPAN